MADIIFKNRAGETVTENGVTSVTFDTVGGGTATYYENAQPTDANFDDDVIFVDSYGKVLYSYSAEDFLALTSLPTVPSRGDNYTNNWNWELADAQTYVSNYGELIIGAIHLLKTTNLWLDIEVELFEGRLNPYLTLAVNGSVTIDWGDSTTSTLSGTSTTTGVQTSHTYPAAGVYHIGIYKPSGNTQCSIIGDSSQARSRLLAFATMGSNPTAAYNSGIRALNFSNSITFLENSFGAYALSRTGVRSINYVGGAANACGNYAFNTCYCLPFYAAWASFNASQTFGNYCFSDCSSLKAISFPRAATALGTYMFRRCYSLQRVCLPGGITAVPDYAFQNCYALNRVVIPEGVTSIGGSAFQNCYNLAEITLPSTVTTISVNAFNGCNALTAVKIPSGVTTINAQTFYNCYSLAVLDLTAKTDGIVTLQNTSAFTGTPTDMIYKVPLSLLSDYQTAQNWSTYSSRFVGV